MKKQNDGVPAFANAGKGFSTTGMSLRQYFAAKAMHGLLSQSGDCAYGDKELALDSVKYADALIKKLGE